MDIIGLNGQAHNGKSTVKDLLLSRANTETQMVFHMAFANPLKMVCHMLFGGETAHWWGDKKNDPLELFSAPPSLLSGNALLNWRGTPRELMQYVGTDMFRDTFAQDFWTLIARRVVNTLERTGAADFPGQRLIVIFDDVRFPQEATLVKEYGGMIYRIVREPFDKFNKPEKLLHVSEYAISRNDINKQLHAMDGSTEELHHIVETIAKDYNLCLLPRASTQNESSANSKSHS